MKKENDYGYSIRCLSCDATEEKGWNRKTYECNYCKYKALIRPENILRGNFNDTKEN